MDLVAVDIGGTHARFAIASVAADGAIVLGEPETLHTGDHASFQTAWEDFGERYGGTLPVKPIVHPQPGLFGDAAAFVAEHGVSA